MPNYIILFHFFLLKTSVHSHAPEAQRLKGNNILEAEKLSKAGSIAIWLQGHNSGFRAKEGSEYWAEQTHKVVPPTFDTMFLLG